MRKNFLLGSLLALGLAALAGWHYRPQLLDLLCGTTPAAPRPEIQSALEQGALILDVRMYVETRKEGAELVPGAKNVPLLRLTRQLDEIPRDRPIVTFCASGKRAGKAADMLNARGFNALSGGGIADVQEILASIGPSVSSPPEVIKHNSQDIGEP